MTDENMIRWGIMSTGGIAEKFANGLSVLPDAKLVAVGSRTQASADDFGDRFGVPNRHGSYEALANDPEVDVIYIGTPHPFHHANALLCLEAGKHVLLEKPFAMNLAETKEIIEKAKEKNVFLMEAMWMWFIPIVRKAKEIVESGEIGTPNFLSADFGFYREFDPAHRLFNPDLGGGTLLDIGVYPISFTSLMFGIPPKEMKVDAVMGETGVDEVSTFTFKYEDGKVAHLNCTFRAATTREAVVAGEKGLVRVHREFWCGDSLSVELEDSPDYTVELPKEGNGYNYEAAEVMQCIRDGKLESDVMPHAETLRIMTLLDDIRAEWGLSYPME